MSVPHYPAEWSLSLPPPHTTSTSNVCNFHFPHSALFLCVMWDCVLVSQSLTVLVLSVSVEGWRACTSQHMRADICMQLF